MKPDSNVILARYIIVFLFLNIVYASFSALLVKLFYSITLTDPRIYIDYLISAGLTWLEIKRFFITIPTSLLPHTQALGYPYDTLVGYGFKIVADDLPFSWLLKPIPYVALLSIPLAGVITSKLSAPQSDSKHVRGSRIASTKQLQAILRKAQESDTSGVPGLQIAPLHLPGDLETRHILTAGSTGTGKSVLLCQAIYDIMRRKNKTLIYDRKGELFAKFGKTDDILWNPYDARFCGWTIFSEFELYAGLEFIPEELSTMANSLFSTAGNNKNRAFYDGAASIFKSGCCYLKIHGLTTNKDLYTFFSSGADSMSKAIATLPEGLREGQAFLVGGGDVSASFISCLMDRVKAFQPFIGRDGVFSVREWISNADDRRVLFLSTAGENEASYLPIVTMLIDIVGNGIRSLPENPKRRIFLILDELSSLPPLKSLQMLLREGRSKGASCFLTTQTMAAIEDQYGQACSADIMGLCNSLFIFRTNEPQQSEYFSKALGDAETVKFRQTQGQSKRNGVFWGSDSNQSVSEQHSIERLFLAGELQSLPVGHAVVKIANYPVAKVQFANIQIPERTAGFIRRKVHFASEEELATAKSGSDSTVKEKALYSPTEEQAPKLFKL